MGSDTQEKGFNWLEVDKSDGLYLLRRHLVALVVLPLVGFVLAYAVAKALKPVFSTKTVSYLRPNFDKEMQLEQTFSKLDDADSLRSFEKAMNSDTVILQMVDRLGLRDDENFIGEPIPEGGFTDAKLLSKIRDRYKTKLVPTTRLVELTVEDFSAERTALIADTLIDEFLTHLRDDRNQKEAELRETLISQSQKALQGALDSEKKLKQFRSDHPETMVEQDSKIFHERILQNGTALNQANSERSSLEGILAELSTIDPEIDPYRVFQLLSNRNSEYLSDLLTMQAAAKVELASVRERVTDKHQDYLAAHSRLEKVEETLRNYAREMKEGVESEYAAAGGKADRLREALSGLQGDFIDFKTTSAAFRGVKEEIDRNWNTYTKLQQKIMDLDLDPEVTPTFVTVVSKPVVPDKKTKPRTLFWVAGGTFLGGVLALCLVYWKNRDGLPFTSARQASAQLGSTTFTELGVPGEGGLSAAEGSAMFNILVSLRGAQLVHVSSLACDRSGGRLTQLLGELWGSRGTRTMLVTFKHDLKQPSPIRASRRIPALSTIDVPAALLTGEAALKENLQRLLNDFERIILDTTRLGEMEARLAVANIADANLLIVRGEEGSPRSEYRRFVDQCTAMGVAPVTLAYLSRDSATGEKHGRSRAQIYPKGDLDNRSSLPSPSLEMPRAETGT